jgi:hypothetical protein
MDEASRYLAELAHQSLREINDAVKGHRDFFRCLIEEAEAELVAVLASSQQQQEQQVGTTAWQLSMQIYRSVTTPGAVKLHVR